MSPDGCEPSTPPRGPYRNKSAVFSSRITPEVRELLVEASRRNGRSLSQEIEERLQRSFEREWFRGDLIKAFGGQENYALFRVCARIVKMTEALADRRGDRRWLEDPYTFRAALQAIHRFLSAFDPGGEAVPPAEDDRDFSPETLPAVVFKNALVSLLSTREDGARAADFGLGEPGRIYPSAVEALGPLLDRLEKA